MDNLFTSTPSNFRTQEAAKQILKTASELQDKLTKEVGSFRSKGMNLPMNSIENLNEITRDFDKLVSRIQDNQLELLQLRNLAKTTELINSSLELTSVLENVMDRVVQLVGAERGYIVLRNEETDELDIAVARKLSTRFGQDDELILSRSVVNRVMETNEPVVSSNAQEDERFDGQGSISGYSLRSIICVPLTFHGEVTGAVYCDNRVRDGMFGRRELRLLTAFSNQAAIAIENAQLFEQISHTLEELTQIKTLLDNILSSIASGVVTIDSREVVTIYNQAAEIIFNRDSAQTVGHTIDVALKPLYYKIRNIMRQIGVDEDYLTLETDIEVRERGTVNLNLQLSPLRSAENLTQGIALVADDLTEIKQRDAMLTAVRRYLPPMMVDNIQEIDRLALGGERREITILYVDVRSFDTFNENMPPRELMDTLNTYLTIATEGIHNHAGMIDKYMGSEIMCLFNTQLNPMEDHAWQAVQSAMRIAHDLETLAAYMLAGVADKPYYRIGINTGIATLGNVGSSARREFSAIGDSVNLAKRVQETAGIGQVLISENTLFECEDHIQMTSAYDVQKFKTLQVKGRTQETTLYEIFKTEA